ncbi:N/A [soil metagenome]
MRIISRRVGWALIGAGLFVFAFLGYQLYVTDFLNSRTQTAASAALDGALADRRMDLPAPEVVVVPTTQPEVAPEVAEPPPQVTYLPETAGEEGEAVARLIIESIDVDEVVFAGVSRDTLKKGPGHMLFTPVPGQPGNAVLSGHRTTYGRPFYDLDVLELGDLIEIETALGTHVFAVRRSFVVAPTDVWVTDSLDGAWLTLTTCHPHFSAAERLIIQAELVDGPNVEYANLVREQGPLREEPT